MRLPHKVDKPWGHELWWALTEAYAGKILHVHGGHKLSLQFHEHKDESAYLLSGRLLLKKGPSEEELETVELRAGDTWRNMPGEVHTIEAVEDCEILEVSTPELDDVVRLTDSYGREGTSAP
jgi:mannose-6-phosphate isomerase